MSIDFAARKAALADLVSRTNALGDQLIADFKTFPTQPNLAEARMPSVVSSVQGCDSLIAALESMQPPPQTGTWPRPAVPGVNVPAWNNVTWINSSARFPPTGLTNGQANFNDLATRFGQAVALSYFGASPSINSVANEGSKLGMSQTTQSNIINAYGGQGTAGVPSGMQVYSFMLGVTVRTSTLHWQNTDGSTASIALRWQHNDRLAGT